MLTGNRTDQVRVSLVVVVTVLLQIPMKNEHCGGFCLFAGKFLRGRELSNSSCQAGSVPNVVGLLAD